MTATSPTLFALDSPEAARRPRPRRPRHWASRIPCSPAADAWAREDRPAELALDALAIAGASREREAAEPADYGPFATPLPDLGPLDFRDWREADRRWRARLPGSRAMVRAARGMIGAGV